MVFDTGTPFSDLLGIWQVTTIELLSDSEAPLQSTWQVDLPANPRQALKMIANKQKRLASASLALPQAEARLRNFTSYFRQNGLGFALPSNMALSPEVDLQRFLAHAQHTASSTYGLGDLFPQISELVSAANRLAMNIRLSVVNSVQVETSQVGRFVGCTRVSWLGDFSTEWGINLNSTHSQMHRQAVSLALATRQSWVRVGLLVASAGANLASILSGNPLALLGVFQFVRQVIDKVQEQQTILRRPL